MKRFSCGQNVDHLIMFGQCFDCCQRTLMLNQTSHSSNIWTVSCLPENIKPSGSCNFSIMNPTHPQSQFHKLF